MKIINYRELTPELAKAGCFVLDMPNEAYHSYQGISKSGLDLINRSPAHYHFRAPRKTSRTLELGTALHTAVLEPERFATEYVKLKNTKVRTASEYKEAVKVHTSERVLVAGELANIESIQETVRSLPHISEVLDSCDLFEVSGLVEYEGVMLRIRLDSLSTRDLVAVDLKTTQNSSREDFAKSVYNYRYHVQDAFYSFVFELIAGKPLNAFKFLAVENDPPHCPMIYTLDDEAKRIGLEEAIRNLDTFKQADMMQGYEQTNEPLMLPSWALARYEEELEEMIK